MYESSDQVEDLAKELDRVWRRGVDNVDLTGGRKKRSILPILDGLIAASPWHDQPRPTALRALLTEASACSPARATALQILFDLEPHADGLAPGDASARALAELNILVAERAASTARQTLRRDMARAVFTLTSRWPPAPHTHAVPEAQAAVTRPIGGRIGELSRILTRDLDVAARTPDGIVTLSGGGYVARSVEPDITETLLDGGRDVIIKADPGHGKSTLLWSLARTLEATDAALPVLISASWLLADDQQAPLLDPGEIIRELSGVAVEQRVVVLLDTADILLHSDATRIRTLELLHALTDRGIRWCAATRPLEADALTLDHARVVQLGSYNDKELPQAVTVLARALCPHVDADRLAARIGETIARGLPVATICRSPLLLRLLFEVYAPNEPLLEIDVTDLYGHYWHRRIAADTRSEATPGHGHLESDLSQAASAVGIALLAAGTTTLPRTALLNTINSHHPTTDVPSFTATHMDTLQRRGVLQASGPTIGFFHQTMFEYAAAKGLLGRPRPSDALHLLMRRVQDHPADLFVGAVLEQALILAGADPLQAPAAADVAQELATSEHIELGQVAIAYLTHHPDNHALDLGTVHPLALRRAAQLLPTINHRQWRAVEILIGTLWDLGDKSVRLELTTTLARLAFLQPQVVTRLLQQHDVVGYCVTTDPNSPAVQQHLPRLLATLASRAPQLVRAGFRDLLQATTTIGSGRAVAADMLRLIADCWGAIGTAAYLDDIAALMTDAQADADADANRAREALSLVYAAAWSDAPADQAAWTTVLTETIHHVVEDNEAVIAGARLIAVLRVLANLPADDPQIEATLDQLFAMPGQAAPRQLQRGALPIALARGGYLADAICARFQIMLVALRDRDTAATRGARVWGEVARTTLADGRIPLERITASIPSQFRTTRHIWGSSSGLALLAPAAAAAGIEGARRQLEAISAQPDSVDQTAQLIILEHATKYVATDPLIRATFIALAVATDRPQVISKVLEQPGGADALRPESDVLRTMVTALLARGNQHQQRDGAHLWGSLIVYDLTPPQLPEFVDTLAQCRGPLATAAVLELLPHLRHSDTRHEVAAARDLCLDYTRDWIHDGQTLLTDTAAVPERHAIVWEAARAAYLELAAFDPEVDPDQWTTVRAFTLTPRTNGTRRHETSGFGNAAAFISRLFNAGHSHVAADALSDLITAIHPPSYSTKQTRNGAFRIRGAVQACFQHATFDDQRRIIQHIATAAEPVASVIARTAVQECPDVLAGQITELRKQGLPPGVIKALNDETRLRKRIAGVGVFSEILD